MTENATIFIPDISGYTEFLSRTELEHSAHIINELMELLVEANTSDCTLAEVEGDALLFYRKGEPMSREMLISQCLEMFRVFHTRLKLIERDSICQCGACQNATDLTLKFVVHYGPIKEIRISHFTKASGLDMIIAHRLLKNSIQSNEYILTTQRYLQALNDQHQDHDLTWTASSESYPVIGRLDYHFAMLDTIRHTIPDPPLPEKVAFMKGSDTIAIDIDLGMEHVYDLLVELENRVHWIPGLKHGQSEQAIDRIGTRHMCVFDDETYEVIPLERQLDANEIRYVEMNTGVVTGLAYPSDFLLKKLDNHHTHLEIKIGEVPEYPLDDEVLKMVLHEWHLIAEGFKVFCEAQVDKV
jgi:hypothetical protein